MFGFPVNLQDSGVQKFTNDADSGFPKIQQREVFYSVKNGNWDDVTIWQTASGRIGKLPSQWDDVYIRHSVTCQGLTYNCFNLIITNEATFSGNGFLNIYGNLKSFGTMNYLPNAGSFSNGAIYLYGTNNYIDKTKQTASVISYAGSYNQPIIDANYSLLAITGSGEKALTSDLSIGAFHGITGTTGNAWINCKNYNFTCVGNFDTTNNYIGLYVEGNQTLTFGGTLARFYGGIYCLNAPTFEFKSVSVEPFLAGRNPANWTTPYASGINIASYFGTGTIRFTTNNQTALCAYTTCIVDATISIENINLSISGTSATLILNKPINGTTPTSKLTQNTNSVINFNTQLAAENSMTTGIWDFTTNANTIGYTGNYTATIPSYFTTFHNLTISGTGTKSLGVNTTLNGNLSLGISNSIAGTLECSTYNLFVNGNTTYNGPSNSTQYGLTKSGSGNITFVGVLAAGYALSSYILDFSLGNPNVELRGGIQTYRQQIPDKWKTGSGTWTFTTNNQSITDTAGGPSTYFDCPIVIASGITLTIDTNTNMYLNNTINGASITSSLVVKARLNFNTLASLSSMSVGTFDFLTNATSTIGYTLSNNCTLPFSTYNNLTFDNGGIKTASANTLIQGNLLLGSSAPVLQMSTFNLQVNGTTTMSNGGVSKSGAGNVLFIGKISNASLGTPFIDFSGGNPSVEVRGGIEMWRAGTNFKSGTGTWTFSTNNQSITDLAYSGIETFNGPVLISGAITLTIGSSLSNQVGIIFNQGINGNNTASTLSMGANAGTSHTITYNSATKPMATGILDTSTNLNTWIYGNANQDILGGPTTGAKQVYRNLTLNGGGTKTLQGYVSVLNTYALTSPATLNNNGFTLTNP